MGAAADVETLCEALGLSIQATAGTASDEDERLLDRETLAIKCLFHSRSCLLLAAGTPVGRGAARVLDLGSINVLVRATLESALVFHHLFVAPKGDAEAEFRHLSWVLADVLERQEFPATLPESQKTQREERMAIDAISARLRANPELQRLTAKQQKRVLEEGHWSPGWATVARTAGLSELHATDVHRHLCSYAHSGSMSVMQARAVKTRDEQERLLSGALQLVCIALALMTQAYVSVFPKASEALRQSRALAAKVDAWIGIGSGRDA
jgi:hypothetical protein